MYNTPIYPMIHGSYTVFYLPLLRVCCHLMKVKTQKCALWLYKIVLIVMTSYIYCSSQLLAQTATPLLSHFSSFYTTHTYTTINTSNNNY